MFLVVVIFTDFSSFNQLLKAPFHNFVFEEHFVRNSAKISGFFFCFFQEEVGNFFEDQEKSGNLKMTKLWLHFLGFFLTFHCMILVYTLLDQ